MTNKEATKKFILQSLNSGDYGSLFCDGYVPVNLIVTRVSNLLHVGNNLPPPSFFEERYNTIWDCIEELTDEDLIEWTRPGVDAIRLKIPKPTKPRKYRCIDE